MTRSIDGIRMWINCPSGEHGRTLEHANEEVRTLLAEVDRLTARASEQAKHIHGIERVRRLEQDRACAELDELRRRVAYLERALTAERGGAK